LAYNCLPLAAVQISNANDDSPPRPKVSDAVEVALAMATAMQAMARGDTERAAEQNYAPGVQADL
jgi:hypothetical protein